MNVKSVLPSRRRLSFFVIISSLVAVFFLGYYFYFVPANKAVEHKNAFLILENIQQNIRDRNAYLQTAFINILRKPAPGTTVKSIVELQQQLDNYKLNAVIFYDKNDSASASNNLSKSSALTLNTNSADSSVYLSGISGDSLFYKPVSTANRTYKIYVPSASFFEPLLAYQKTELFSYYLLLGKQSGLIYADKRLAINNNLAPDSLLQNNGKFLFSGIKDVNLNGSDYKLFYYPFKLGTAQVQLCGLVNTTVYNSNLQQVPVSFIYPIVIAMVLIFLLLPLVKFNLMGKDEHVRYSDFLLGLFSFFAGTAMLTIIIIQVLLLLAADIRATENVEKISTQVSSRFSRELTGAYLELKLLDSIIAKDSTAKRAFCNHQNKDVSDSIKNHFSNPLVKHQHTTYDFNRISWIDDNGDQHLKADMISAAPVFTNVKDRKYFQMIRQQQGFGLPGYPGAAVGFEPVNSWTNGDFAVLLSIRSELQGAVTAMALQMPSVLQSIVPPGYGYCIMDADGNVLLHSDMHRNLQENFIEKADPSRRLKEAVKSRQNVSFSDINLYGNLSVLNIRPVDGMPFYISTFYDKGYIVPVNMRIFTFSLLFCIITFATCLFIWLVVFKKRSVKNSFLYEPAIYFNWIVPKKNKHHFYLLGTVFLFLYLVIQMLVIFSFGYSDISNYAVLLVVMLMPVNIFSGLYIIDHRMQMQKALQLAPEMKMRQKRTMYALVFQPLCMFVVWGYSFLKELPIEVEFLYFGLFFFVLLIGLYFLPKKWFAFLYNLRGDYQVQYARFATLLVLCLGAFPAGMYTWYAHNQEIVQAVKKQQLYLAAALKNREAYNLNAVKDRLPLHPAAAYFDTLQYHRGIYTIYNDNVRTALESEDTIKNDAVFEQFYFSVASQIGNNYYDPLTIPVLQDSAADGSWHWDKKKDILNFWYPRFASASNSSAAALSLNIKSIFPPRYVFAGDSINGFLLKLVMLVLVYGLYRLIKFVANRLFLRKYIRYWEKHTAEGEAELQKAFQDYRSAAIARGAAAGLLPNMSLVDFEKEQDDIFPVTDADRMYTQEKLMTQLLLKYKGFYNFLWEQRTPKEHYMLLDFALHGFVNFKNTDVIHGLLKRGIFTVKDEEITLFSKSFRSFILTQLHSKAMQQLEQEFKQEGPWQSIRIPLLVVMLGVAFFIFFTQQEAFQKISALVAGVGTVFSLLIKFFSDSSSIFTAKK